MGKAKKILKFDQILVYSAILKNNQLYHNFDIVYDLGKIMHAFGKRKLSGEQNIRLFKRRH